MSEKSNTGSEKEASELTRQASDLSRARAFGDGFRKYLLTALTGGIGLCLGIAGSLVGKGVPPQWATSSIIWFSAGLVTVGLGLLMGEHRSLCRRKDPNFQHSIPVYKMGITWNLIPLVLFACGIWSAVQGLNGISLPADKDGQISPTGSKDVTGSKEIKDQLNMTETNVEPQSIQTDPRAPAQAPATVDP